MIQHLADSIQSITLLIFFLRLLFLSVKHINSLKEIKWLFIIPLSAILQLIYSSLGILYLETNIYNTTYNYITSLYIIIEYLIVFRFFYSHKRFRHSSQRLALIFLVPLLYAFYQFFFNHIAINNNELFISITSILFLVLSVITFLWIILEREIDNLYKYPEFYFNSAVFLLYSNNIPINVFNSIIQNNLSYYFFIYTAINCICYSAFYFLLIKYVKCKVMTP